MRSDVPARKAIGEHIILRSVPSADTASPASSGRGAIFISYASEDLESAQKIADALAAAGFHVWFDKEELRGGDSWDLKIRTQIKECSLFMPIISAASSARLEGYFRREWKLAIDRTHNMAQEKTFLYPVAIDSTPSTGMGIPEKFGEVQWSHFPADKIPESFLARVARLLDNRPPMASGSSVSYKPGGAGSTPAVAAPSKKNMLGLYVGAAFAAAIAAGVILWQRSAKPAEQAATPPTPAVVANPFPTDPTLHRAWNLIWGYKTDAAGHPIEADSGPEDFALAEELTKKVLELKPDDPEANIVYAQINDWYVGRLFDRSDERYALAGKFANRAMELSPNNPEALVAMGHFILLRSSNAGGATQLFRQAIKLNPDEPRYYRLLSYSLSSEQGLESLESSAVKFPNDYLTHYDLSSIYEQLGLTAKAEEALDRCIAINPHRDPAIYWKAYYAYSLHMDMPRMRKYLDEVEGAGRLTERFAVLAYAYSYQTGNPAYGLDILKTLPGSEVHDWSYVGPKDLLQGDLMRLSGNTAGAALKYAAALTAQKAVLERNPSNTWARLTEAWIYFELGQIDEAKADWKLNVPDYDRPYRGSHWWFSPLALGLLLHEPDALVLLRESLSPDAPRRENVLLELKGDVRLKTVVASPEVQAILAAAAK